MENGMKELANEIMMVKIPSLDNQLFEMIKLNTVWDNSMVSRKTVSYGVPYNYSGQEYQFCAMPRYLHPLMDFVHDQIGFFPNNCLINYYVNGDSKMGFHSDQVDQLVHGTGIAIVSLGDPRIIRFRNKIDKGKEIDFTLDAGTLFYMSQEIQKHWLHAVLPDKNNSQSERISLTFRRLTESVVM
ncbi:alpha-ketoglutarate-dependent dioxygenase AlkB [Mucilaginibacter sp. KACC 22773]|uniref:alpha-ketoglutarate-dependent dioxygenase AlkB n=1 Tax=Mucilaginibacter sp. KACC 22773 TaxID=3025671 RepID=UPI00236667D7|nr:alpha-ketoglutarate-dependent dioxygenase AlkB [Mucilaginibacter sp. KACC 22773]WDF78605.1 alpha-ketoglutarate-dependent dioxygenase AlkB [Mucilaginibacter sp. KACC 22773]